MQASDWNFAAEGNAHCVFAAAGDRWAGRVLRVRKRSSDGSALAFADQVVKPLLGELALSLERYDVDRTFLADLAARADPIRDPARRAKGDIDMDAAFVVLTDDLTASTKARPLRLVIELKVCSLARLV